MLRRSVLLTVLAAAACAPAAPPPTLPGGPSGSVTTDPITSARQNAAAFFGSPQAGKPAEAARAIADIEFLAGAVPSDPRWQSQSGNATTQLVQARDQARSALGIPRGADAQAVIDGLMSAATALEANDRAGVARALPRTVFTAGPDQTVRRLATPPRIPSASAALYALGAGAAANR